jgi:hypothetical protein
MPRNSVVVVSIVYDKSMSLGIKKLFSEKDSLLTPDFNNSK